MPNELMFTVRPGEATPARPISLAEAGLKERADLQEWVRNNPEILGEDVLIVTFEFDRWRANDGRAADRLDLLGLDPDGRLVVAELKRGRAPDTVEMQAIKYAAFASRFSPETLADAYAAYASANETDEVTADEALRRLNDHVGAELDQEGLRRPRVVLLAERFPPQVTASAVWLTEMGVEVSLVEFNAYRTENDMVLAVSQVWPVQDKEDLTISPRGLDNPRSGHRSQGRRRRRTVPTLVEEGVIEDGAPLRLRTEVVPPEVRQRVADWIAEDPRRGNVTWRNDERAPLTWGVDGQHRLPTTLAKEIVQQATGNRPDTAGPWWWETEDGVNLGALAGEVSGRDWSDLHRLLETVQTGEWTTYGDLAQAIGSSARAVGKHISVCDRCSSAHRVLNADGKVADGFHWSDPDDTSDPAEMLAQEGVAFSNGRADPAHRLDAATFRGRM